MGVSFQYLLHNKFLLPHVHKKLWRGQIESGWKVGWLFKDGLRMLLSAIAALDHLVWLKVSETSGVKKGKFVRNQLFFFTHALCMAFM